MGPLVMTFDVGSQSVRAIIVDKDGNIQGSYKLAYKEICLPSSNPDYAEQDPRFYYDMICQASIGLKNNVSADVLESVKAVSITCIRDTVLILDKDHKPLRNIITWMDRRRASGLPKLSLFKRAVLALVGLTDSINMLYKDSFYNWIRENEPELWEKTDKFVMLPGYLNYLLTGVLKDAVANQVGHIPLNNRKRAWMKKGFSRCVADVPIKNLIDLVETGEVIGYINSQTAACSAIPQGLPLIATGPDKACEALGLSVTTREKAAISLGTAASIQFVTPRYFEPSPFIPAFPSIIPGYFNGEDQIYRGYWIVRWFIENFCHEEVQLARSRGCEVEDILDSYLSEIPAGCDGLVMTPNMHPGMTNPHTKSIMVGLTDIHTKKHIYKAIVEGINFELYHAMKRMERRSGQKIKVLYAGGGGSRSDTVLQILANVFGLPVKRTQTNETTAIGSSLAAFVGLGEFQSYDQAASSMIHDGKVFYPDMKAHALYMNIYNGVYKNLEKSNRFYFRRLSKILLLTQR